MSKSIKTLIVVLTPPQETFLPLALVQPLELWLLGGQPLVQYLVEEAKEAGLKEIIFVGPSQNKSVYSYFKPKLREGGESFSKGVQELVSRYKNISFQFVGSNKTLSSGEIILKLKAKLKAPWIMTWSTGVFCSPVSSFSQLEKIFRTSQKPVLGLVENSSHRAWDIRADKIAQRIFKINQISRSKKKELNPSLGLANRYVLTPTVIDFLEKLRKEKLKNQPLKLEEALASMLESGQPLYGYQLKGDWFNLNSLENWLKADFYLSLHHPLMAARLKEYLRDQHLC